MTDYVYIQKSPPLSGTVVVSGAKNAVLVMMACLLLTRGVSTLTNVPNSEDVHSMIQLLQSLGATVVFDVHRNRLQIDTAVVDGWSVSADIMNKMRASILVMGPLLAVTKKVAITYPGGCSIGARPIDYHLKNFQSMGATVTVHNGHIHAYTDGLKPARIILEYPSIGATENIIMAAVLTKGITTIINAALEPEVIDLITLLQKMGANIMVQPPATLTICGVDVLQPVEYAVMPDRLEAGALLLAAAITGGNIQLMHAPVSAMDLFLFKLQEMGHTVVTTGTSIALQATRSPQAVSFKTGPYPSFPTDLQAPMMAVQCVAQGTSMVEETVFENRLLHTTELQKMGAHIVVDRNRATVQGVSSLQGALVNATDIRASCALMLAGLVAGGTTIMTGIHHWRRGYDALETKLTQLGARIQVIEEQQQAIDHAKAFHEEWLKP